MQFRTLRLPITPHWAACQLQQPFSTVSLFLALLFCIPSFSSFLLVVHGCIVFCCEMMQAVGPNYSHQSGTLQIF